MHHGPNVSICGECVAFCVETMAKGERHWRDPIDGQTVDQGLIDITPGVQVSEKRAGQKPAPRRPEQSEDQP